MALDKMICVSETHFPNYRVNLMEINFECQNLSYKGNALSNEFSIKMKTF